MVEMEMEMGIKFDDMDAALDTDGAEDSIVSKMSQIKQDSKENAWNVERKEELSDEDRARLQATEYKEADFRSAKGFERVPINSLLKRAVDGVGGGERTRTLYQAQLKNSDELFEIFKGLDEEIEAIENETQRNELYEARNSVLNQALETAVNTLTLDSQRTERSSDFDFKQLDNPDYVLDLDPRLYAHYDRNFKVSHEQFKVEKEKELIEGFQDLEQSYELHFEEFCERFKEDPREAFDAYFSSGLAESKEELENRIFSEIENDYEQQVSYFNDYRGRMVAKTAEQDGLRMRENLKTNLMYAETTIRKMLKTVSELSQLKHVNDGLRSAGGKIEKLDGKIHGIVIQEKGMSEEELARLEELKALENREFETKHEPVFLNEYGYFINYEEMKQDLANQVAYRGDWFGYDEFAE